MIKLRCRDLASSRALRHSRFLLILLTHMNVLVGTSYRCSSSAERVPAIYEVSLRIAQLVHKTH
jgi:hypothetical protein